jgi:hypothetical protein
VSIDVKTFFVHGAVVSAAQHRQIRQCRRTAVRPMAKVMALAEG